MFYFEVCVSKNGGPTSSADPFRKCDKTHWVRKGQPRETFAECQADAIANGERPYRIKKENAPQQAGEMVR